MSRKIDLSDPSNLTEDEVRYLQERDKLPAGVDPVMTPGVVNMALPENTGSAVTEPAPSGGNSIPAPSTSAPAPATSSEYDEMTVKELKDEVDRRNEARDAESQLSKPSKKDDLIAVLATDDEESSQIVE